MNDMTRPESTQTPATVTGHRGLDLEEKLIFETARPEATGVDLPAPSGRRPRLGALTARTTTGLPGLSEPETIRHFTRLSRMNYAIDYGTFPLGSCTMKHNPRLNERMARLPGLADLHPLQPTSTAQGALRLMSDLAHWLTTLTGMETVALTPGAGAQGELCGMMAIRARLEADGEAEQRTRVLVPESAHGTNPATAAGLGFTVESIPANRRGAVDLEDLKSRLGDDIAGVMITNPNTGGIFESKMAEIAKAVHAAGGYVYCDGANFNAIVGRVRPADLGIDAMHINLHKTFSTPHGGGGPGSGPVVFSRRLADFVPVPFLWRDSDGRFTLVEDTDDPRAAGKTMGRLKGFHGQMGMFIRALAYMLSHGRDGLYQVAGDAVLNANYLLSQLGDVMTAAYPAPTMHEVLFSDRFLKDTGVTTLDFAKGMIDEGFHPMTVYFPLVVQGAMLVEPTETESKEGLDLMIAAMRSLAERAKSGDAQSFTQAPRLVPRRRLDETTAARKPILRWRPESQEPDRQAAA